ncbi:hypothetical protein [Vibrio vulnificus]|uniref:hypothetical protein n=1 Tax=Vibrio vulnificus TaxID=672 RepID=UPI001EEC4F6F|nr:hypothetical protein [Vibrio vulnificus]MCG6290373.1 hypothetical protein [Vibrio vulnificus]
MYTEQEQQTIDIVERQLEAYNRRDIEALQPRITQRLKLPIFQKGCFIRVGRP